MAYVDTSVLVACYCPETHSDMAERAVNRSGPPTISPLTEVEFRSALAIKVRAAEMESDAARRVAACFRTHCEEGAYRFVPIEGGEYALAGGWLDGFSTPLRTVDALHLAAAFSNGLSILTADRALARSAKTVGVKCRLVF
ncbi:MAG: type II toxin-antitoxin system VapC family toxin [Planctomycetes bacterium]|nr:type II toxin-antitoxin system VapC family toxin [Planctomycetota bacterium]